MASPQERMAKQQREFGEWGGVNCSIEASSTFTVLKADTSNQIFKGMVGPSDGEESWGWQAYFLEVTFRNCELRIPCHSFQLPETDCRMLPVWSKFQSDCALPWTPNSSNGGDRSLLRNFFRYSSLANKEQYIIPTAQNGWF